MVCRQVKLNDCPMDEFTAHMFGAIAQCDRKLISSCTRDGLAALKGVTRKTRPCAWATL